MLNHSSRENVFFVDLHHPGNEDAEINKLFSGIPANTKRIFLLGDIFHVWINDEEWIKEKYSFFLDQLKQWSAKGIDIFFIEGNRDFLASHYFENESWIEVLPNPTVMEIGGQAVYIGHGDELCWNDWAYQFYKSVIRSRWMRFLANRLPSSFRRRTVQKMAQTSTKLVARKKKESLAIPRRAYEAIISTGIDVIIHGHLHESYQREYKVGDMAAKVVCFGWQNDKRNFIHIPG